MMEKRPADHLAHWSEIEPLLDQALALAPSQREGFLDTFGRGPKQPVHPKQGEEPPERNVGQRHRKIETGERYPCNQNEMLSAERVG